MGQFSLTYSKCLRNSTEMLISEPEVVPGFYVNRVEKQSFPNAVPLHT